DFDLLPGLGLFVDQRSLVRQAVRLADRADAERLIGLGEVTGRMIEVRVAMLLEVLLRGLQAGQHRVDAGRLIDPELEFDFVVHWSKPILSAISPRLHGSVSARSFGKERTLYWFNAAVILKQQGDPQL